METTIRQQSNITGDTSSGSALTLSMHPKKFALWLFILSIVMIFASITSAYLVSQADRVAKGLWLQFDLPPMFWFTSAVIVVSSATMHWAYISAKRDNFGNLKIASVVTAILGLIFMIGQVLAWGELVDINVFFAGNKSNPAGSFVYVISGLHAFHIVAGLVFLVALLIGVARQNVHSKNMTLMEMTATFWHFLDGLWIYLFLFLLFTRV